MRKWIMVSCSVLALALLARTASALPTLDELLAKMAKAAPELKSCTGDMKMTIAMGDVQVTVVGRDAGMASTRDGKAVWKSMETGEMNVKTPDGQNVKLERKEVNDGAFNWEEIKNNLEGSTTVTKTLADAKDEMGMQKGLDPLKEFQAIWNVVFTLRVTGEDTVDGEKVYVLEGKLNEGVLKVDPNAPPVKEMMNTIRLCIGQNDLILRKLTTWNADGKEIITMESSNMKVNGAVDEKLFDYTPPDDAKIVDKTKPGE